MKVVRPSGPCTPNGVLTCERLSRLRPNGTRGIVFPPPTTQKQQSSTNPGLRRR